MQVDNFGTNQGYILSWPNDELFLRTKHCPKCDNILEYAENGYISLELYIDNEVRVYNVQNIPSAYCSDCRWFFISFKEKKLLHQLAKNFIIKPEIVNDLLVIKDQNQVKPFKCVIEKSKRNISKIINPSPRNGNKKGNRKQSLDLIHGPCFNCNKFKNQRCTISMDNVDPQTGCNLFVKVISMKTCSGGRVSPK